MQGLSTLYSCVDLCFLSQVQLTVEHNFIDLNPNRILSNARRFTVINSGCQRCRKRNVSQVYVQGGLLLCKNCLAVTRVGGPVTMAHLVDLGLCTHMVIDSIPVISEDDTITPMVSMWAIYKSIYIKKKH